METVAVARHAMATRFEIVLHGDNAVALRAAGEEALDEIEQLEGHLSLYRPTSDIAQINARAAAGPVRVEPTLFRLLQQARRLWEESQGAFDITIAPLMRCWGFMGGNGQLADPAAVAEARRRVGMDKVILNAEEFTVHFAVPGMMLDLGSIGKGYALERAALLLREAGVTSALVHGGTSTACAIGAPPGAEDWHIAVERPRLDSPNPAALTASPPPEPETILAHIPLRDEALSVSAIWGKSFEANGRRYGHVMDPRTGEPTEGALLAAVVLPSAMETDAFSTALLTLGLPGHDYIAGLRAGMRTLVVARGQGIGALEVKASGIATTESKNSG